MKSILLAILLFIAAISILAQPAVKPADKPIAPAAAANVAADQTKNKAELAAQIVDLEAKLADAKAKMKAMNADARTKMKAEQAKINADVMAKIMPYLPYTNPENTILKATDQGLFIIGSGVIAKYDIKTLAPLGSLRLVDIPAQTNMKYRKNVPMGVATTNVMPANQPVDAPVAPAFDWVKNNRDNQLIMAKPVVIEDGKDLIIILNDKFFRVGMEKVDLVATADMTVKDGVVPNNNTGGEVPTVQLVDDTLYVMRGGNLWSLNAADGKELGQAKIPTDLNIIPKYLNGIGGPMMMDMNAAGAM